MTQAAKAAAASASGAVASTASTVSEPFSNDTEKSPSSRSSY
jgi:hypothetical protein